MGRLDGRVAIVTGAGGGIGREHALLLAREGAAVLVNDLGTRTGSDAQSVVEAIRAAGGTAAANTTSATWDGAHAIVDQAVAEFGRVDILVNNATYQRNDDLWRYTESDFDRTIAVNLKGYFAMIAAVTPQMARQRAGAIVSTASASGFGHPSHAAYAAAKEGVVGLTRTAAMELGRFGIRANAIRPLAHSVGVEEYHEQTKPWRELMDVTMGASSKTRTPEEIHPRKIAPLVVWLCTDAASGVNGRTFFVSGATVMLYTEPRAKTVITREDGWTLDALDEIAPTELVEGVRNRFTLDEFPHLQEFPD
jgi:NAD(P)-dependent dehydrogenase (short-subunit alcohol dehydrogenase family)